VKSICELVYYLQKEIGGIVTEMFFGLIGDPPRLFPDTRAGESGWRCR